MIRSEVVPLCGYIHGQMQQLLSDEAEKIPVAGKVIWITPRGAQGNRAAGIGVQFTDQDNTAVTKIETYLAGSVNSDKPTHTM